MLSRFTWTEPKLCSHADDMSRKDWFIYFDVTDTSTGVTIRKQFRGTINRAAKKEERKRQGEALISYWKKELKAGWSPFDTGSLPLEVPLAMDAFNMVLELKSASCGVRTLYCYRYAVKNFFTWLKANRIQNIKIRDLQPNHCRAYMDHLTRTKNYCGRSFNDQLVMMGTFCNCMVERDWIASNPFAKIKRLPTQVGRNIAYSEEERILLLNHLYENDREMYYFTQFIYYCFIRRSELTRLKVCDINWPSMNIIIPSSASKNKKQQSVVIPKSFVPILTEMNLQNLPGEYYIFGRKMKPGLIKYVNDNHISTRHNSAALNLGIPANKGLYSWKHTGVCELYPLLKGDMYAMMTQLRHTELTTTQIYLKSLGLKDNTSVRNAVW